MPRRRCAAAPSAFPNASAAASPYAIARLSRVYAAWPYRDVLEERIRRAHDNVAVFNQANFGGPNGMMIRSAFSCMACHQE